MTVLIMDVDRGQAFIVNSLGIPGSHSGVAGGGGRTTIATIVFRRSHILLHPSTLAAQTFNELCDAPWLSSHIYHYR